jgi:hypothetical protein
MAWTDVQQRLGRAVYEATAKEAGEAPMHHPVSVGNYLMRSFPRRYMPAATSGVIPGGLLNAGALTVRDAATDQNRFSGVIPSAAGKPAIAPKRGGMYFSLDARAQLAELLHYTNGSSARMPGDAAFTLRALSDRCLLMCKPRNNLALVTIEEFRGEVNRFYNDIQQHPDVKTALKQSNYGDITQAIFAPNDYSAARGFALGLESDASIDGMVVGSARNFETTGSAGNRFASGDNVVLFGTDQQALTHRIKILSVYTVDHNVPGFAGKWSVQVYEANASGDFVASKQFAL